MTRTRRLRIAAQVAAAGVLASLLLWAPPAVAVTAPRTLADQVAVGAGPVEPGFPIGYVGVLWQTGAAGDDHADEAAVEPHGAVRFRQAGAWGPWTPLLEDGIDAPGRWASGLVPGGRADAYQVRGIPADARGARAVAINTTDGPPVTVGHRPGGAAQAIESAMCRSRAEWGADESLRFGADGTTEIWPAQFQDAQVMTVHHTATRNGDPDPAATVRAIFRYHAVDQGWGDIGYQYLVDESGVVYEGRWSGTKSPPCRSLDGSGSGDGSAFAHEDGTDRMVTGAHTGGWNSGNLGVALLGEFTTHRRTGGHPVAEAVDGLEGLLAELATRHGLDPLATTTYVNPVSAESTVVDTIGGHRDYTATECPGQRLYDLLPTIRQDVAARMATTPSDGAPLVRVTSPLDGDTVAGTAVPLTAEATDDVGVAGVEFSVDGTPVGTGSVGPGGWSAAWDTTTAAEGPHTVTATATDTLGQTASHSVSVTVDNDGLPEPVHVADLDGATRSGKGQWEATARVVVAGLGDTSTTSATVHGTWSTGTAVLCTTGPDGGCSVTSPPVPPSTGSLTFRVTGIEHATLRYDPARNTDPDGDSDGTTLVVAKGS